MSEEQGQQLLYQMQMLESYTVSMDQKEETIMAFLREAISSVESIRGINRSQEFESLIPVGLGTYVKANISGASKVLLNVGAGIVVEKDHNSAINYLESRIKELQVALNETASQKHQLLVRLEQLKQEMNRLIQSSNPPQ
ncbi:MAG TPA: prefoldin subunit alpha [Candidatus Nitrosotenuis sp.]|nr:prefoldin subunit alpha [Candidatus Nitrosotenuis sp.]